MNSPALKQSTEPKPENGNCLSAGELRLNLGGCGEGFRESRIPGFKVVDLREGADYQCDAKDLTIFKTESVLEIYSSNILEHFPIHETVPVLQEWRRVLKTGGKLWLSVPDFEACVRLYLKVGLVPWVQFLIWGDQKHPLNYHYINFTWATMQKALNESGFSSFKRVPALPYGIQDASVLRDNIERKPISLNCEATK